jgi:hypothetical protein
MKRAVYALLTSDDPLNALVPAERWYERSAVPDQPTKPFAVLGYTGRQRLGAGLYQTTMTLGAYQDRGGYDLCAAILKRAVEVLGDAVHYEIDGDHLALAQPMNVSPELFDDAWRANLLQHDFLLLGDAF